MSQILYRTDEQLTYEEYLEFLTRSDLGSQYPRLRFEQRVRRVLKNVDICVTARSEGQLVGVCFGLTDYAYWLFYTDLGVDRAYERRGIGSRMVGLTWEQAGGPEEIFAFTMSHPDALGFYDKCGLPPVSGVVGAEPEQWDAFDVRDLTGPSA
jgi:GNAT superfamily N-acetyltransferase